MELVGGSPARKTLSRRDRHKPSATPGSFLVFAQRELPTLESGIGTSLESSDVRLGEADRTDRSRLIALTRFGDRTVEADDERSERTKQLLVFAPRHHEPRAARPLNPKDIGPPSLGGREPRPYSTLIGRVLDGATRPVASSAMARSVECAGSVAAGLRVDQASRAMATRVLLCRADYFFATNEPDIPSLKCSVQVKW